MRLPILLLCLCVWPLAAIAAEAVSGDEIRLDDGRIVRLLGIKAADDKAQAALQSLIQDRTLNLQNAAPDRYGRVTADVKATSGTAAPLWLQGELLQKGMAYVYPPTGSEPHLVDLFTAEHQARQTRQGIWAGADSADRPADKPDKIGYGHFAFVSGKVVKVERIKNMVYLNFGEDWHRDFTIAIAAHDLRAFRAAGIDPLTYQGKTIRVRGWIKRDFGPMITVTNPAQIEALGEAPVKP